MSKSVQTPSREVTLDREIVGSEMLDEGAGGPNAQ